MEGARDAGSDLAVGAPLRSPREQGVLLVGSAAEAAQRGVSPAGFPGLMLHTGLQGAYGNAGPMGPAVPSQEG